MKRVVTAVALSLTIAGTGAQAGALTDPIVAPEVIIEEASSTSRGFLIPIVLLAIVIAISTSAPARVTVSDARLKTGIVRSGTAPNGLPLYHFRYLGQNVVFEGVMAQDVLQHMPAAVHTYPSGFLGVDYGMLGLEMRRIN